MKREDIRGPAFAPITAIEDVVQEMLGYIRERMRLTPSQVQLLEPVVRRAVHQIARKMEVQPLIYGRELSDALRLGLRRTGEAWVNREFGPGWIIRQGYGTHALVAMCRASFFALLDEWKAKKGQTQQRKAMETLVEERTAISPAKPGDKRLKKNRKGAKRDENTHDQESAGEGPA